MHSQHDAPEYNPTEVNHAFMTGVPCGGGSPHDGADCSQAYDVLTEPEYHPNCVSQGGLFCVSDNQVRFIPSPGEDYGLRDENKDHQTTKGIQEILNLKLRLEVDWLNYKGFIFTDGHAERDVVTIRKSVRDMPRSLERLDALNKIKVLARNNNLEFKYEEELSHQKKLMAVRPFLLKNDEHFRLYIRARFCEFVDFSKDCWLQ